MGLGVGYMGVDWVVLMGGGVTMGFSCEADPSGYGDWLAGWTD